MVEVPFNTAQPNDLHQKSIDWFLYDENIDPYWDNPFLVNTSILYHLKTPENFWFSGVFKRIFWCLQEVWNGNIEQKWFDLPYIDLSSVFSVTNFFFSSWIKQTIQNWMSYLCSPCVKSVQIRTFFRSVFSCIRMINPLRWSFLIKIFSG